VPADLLPGHHLADLQPNGTASAYGIYFISNAGDVNGDDLVD
jgi:hypothetical protein